MWRQTVNTALKRTTGYQLTRATGHRLWRLPPPTDGRLLVAPVFILSPARSGSTLLRAVLGGHSQLYAPPELPLGHLGVQAETRWIQTSMQALQLTSADLEHMLWDRVLADALMRSGKPTIVVKTPSHVLIWRRIISCWPDARFIFLLRHPAAAVASLHASWRAAWHPSETGSLAEAVSKGLRYMTELEEARRALDGFTVRYEDLAADPEATVRHTCHFLGVEYEPAMLDYGRFSQNQFAPGLGDASVKIRSGKIQPPVPPPRPADIPPELRKMCAAWGYLPEAPEHAAVPQQPGWSEPAWARGWPGGGEEAADDG